MSRLVGCIDVVKILATLFIISFASTSGSQVPHPGDIFGFNPGDDQKLANYSQMLDYYHLLAESSDRVQLQEIGTSVLGEPLLLLFISSEENLSQLENLRSISERLARARIARDEADQLINDGKAIVWIDGGLHATEVACAQMTTLLAHRVATEESFEMQHIRNNTVLLLMPVMNPDGLDIIDAWYEKNLGTPFEITRPPWLYHHFVGHDNNRDWFMNNMPESRAVTNVLYNEWYPQIVYNHHQTGPSWSRIFIPPFADPVNPNIHPGVTTGVNILGASMANRFAMKQMPGAVSRVIYSMWWNGGMRTVPYFHNMVGILTETSHATPTPRFYDPDSLPSSIAARRGEGQTTDGSSIFYPYPWKGGISDFKQPVNYMLTASMAVLRSAADQRVQWLSNIYDMGRAAISKGEDESPFAYIIPHEQWNRGEEINLLDILQLGGIEIQEITEDITIDGRSYKAGSHVIFCSQAFRPYLIDLLEKQNYPIRIKNGQPETPYDLAGWTLPMQMGVEVVRIDSTLSIPARKVEHKISIEPGKVHGTATSYQWSANPNNSVAAFNHISAAGLPVSWLMDDHRPNAFWVEVSNAKDRQVLETIASDIGVSFSPAGKNREAVSLQKPRVGLYKSWVANMDEGWTRWLLLEYGFEVDTLHDYDIQTRDLSTYHSIILPHQSTQSILNGHAENTMPEEYTGGIGLNGAQALADYVTSGGTLIAFDAASDFAINMLGLPVRNVVAGQSSRQFFIPGSIVKLQIDSSHILSAGMPDEMGAAFVRSRAFGPVVLSKKREGGITQMKDPPRPDIEVIARYADKGVLMSGFANGADHYLGGKAAMIKLPVGSGSVILFGFRPQFRGQPRGTYKLLFNSIIASAMETDASSGNSIKTSGMKKQ